MAARGVNYTDVMLASRAGSRAAALGQYIYVVGGVSSTGAATPATPQPGNVVVRRDVDMYDTVARRWLTRTPLPGAGAAEAAVFVA